MSHKMVVEDPTLAWPVAEALAEAERASQEEARELLAKAMEGKGLTPKEAAVLLCQGDPEFLEEMFQGARQVKERIYGRRVVLFAPLYTSNYCSNNCLYCGFRRDNPGLKRCRLTQEEILAEAGALVAQGHKRLLLVAGEEGSRDAVASLGETIKAIYERWDIRRINVNIAPLTTEAFRRLKETGIGTYQLFQETYHRETYERMHPSGPKSDYLWRVTAMDRALEAGIEDVGMGVLFGLYDYRYDTVALLSHAAYLDAKYGVGPHTLSVPRLRPALGSALEQVPYPVDDLTFKKIVAVLRLAVPYTGLILSTREPAELRNELLHLGISQVSAGSSTEPGGYHRSGEAQEASQFAVEDHRSLDEVMGSICQAGYIPSFCTACYRSDRTGERFMALAKSGEIQKVCQPNAVLTLAEYLEDYASPETKAMGRRVLEQELAAISHPGTREKTRQRLERVKAGERDIYY